VDLENIKKLFAKKANEAAQANKAKVAATEKPISVAPIFSPAPALQS